MKCACCGANLFENERACHYCGEPVKGRPVQSEPPVIHVHQHEEPHVRREHIYVEHHVRVRSEKRRLTLLLLCIFLGRFGVHKFYEGKTGMGLLYLLTHGLFGVGRVIDIISIAIGQPKDAAGLPIEW